MQRFDAFDKKNHFFVGHLGFQATEKNAQHLQTGIGPTSDLDSAHISWQKTTKKHYVEKQGCVTSSQLFIILDPDY